MMNPDTMMTPQQLTQLQDAVNALDDAYWNHRGADYAEALATIVEITTVEMDHLKAQS